MLTLIFPLTIGRLQQSFRVSEKLGTLRYKPAIAATEARKIPVLQISEIVYYLGNKNKGADQAAQLICAFVFTYHAKYRFSCKLYIS